MRRINRKSLSTGVLRLWIGVVAVTGLLFLASPAQAKILIDDFDAPSDGTVLRPGGSTTDTTDDTSILGGERDMVLDVQTSDGGFDPRLSANDSASQLQYSEGAGADGAFNAVWDGDDGAATTLDETGLGDVDLTESGSNTGILLTGVEWASPPMDLVVDIFTDSANSSQATFGLGSGFNGDIFLGFDNAFTDTGSSGGADFGNVGAIRLSGDPDNDPNESATLTIDGISAATPEPSSFALLGIGVMSMAGYGWRRRRRSADQNPTAT